MHADKRAMVLQEQQGLEGDHRVEPASLQGRHRARRDKEARLASVLQGCWPFLIAEHMALFMTCAGSNKVTDAI